MDATKLPPVPCLATILGAVLALASSGCCLGVEEEPWTVQLDEKVLLGDPLTQIRDGYTDLEMRCAAACVEVGERGGESFSMGDVTACEATVAADAPEPDAPWNPANPEVLITCTAEGVNIPFCTGRRPLGHREAALALGSVGAWFAAHAHLERASITAFAQLAAWLRGRGAPAALIERCEAARVDEIDHAQRMTAQAERFGAEVPAAEVEACPDGLLEVALHNAVEGCVSEAFAAVVAASQARSAEDPELRALFGRIAEDELRHGQLAWDLHSWLLDQLSPAGRARVEQAQAQALARLPELARRGAEATPAGLGWPAPALAEAMARRFAGLLADERAAA